MVGSQFPHSPGTLIRREMMLQRSAKRVRPVEVFGIFFLSSVLLAWKMDVPYEATVNDHLFDRAVLAAEGCELAVQLYFTAPAERYQTSVAARNYYRFRARLEFDGDYKPMTQVFGNRAAGRRVYRTSIDTSSEGCWTKTKPKLHRLNVKGCRGRDCTPKPFD
jgi:hypothetical protein